MERALPRAVPIPWRDSRVSGAQHGKGTPQRAVAAPPQRDSGVIVFGMRKDLNHPYLATRRDPGLSGAWGGSHATPSSYPPIRGAQRYRAPGMEKELHLGPNQRYSGASNIGHGSKLCHWLSLSPTLNEAGISGGGHGERVPTRAAPISHVEGLVSIVR